MRARHSIVRWELAREALQALRDDLAEDEDVADEAGDA